MEVENSCLSQLKKVNNYKLKLQSLNQQLFNYFY